MIVTMTEQKRKVVRLFHTLPGIVEETNMYQVPGTTGDLARDRIRRLRGDLLYECGL